MKKPKGSQNKFGGEWTRQKLKIFISYLESYLIALKHQKFHLVYIDAFAGCGEIEIGENHRIPGSAILALLAREKFDHYYFIEKAPNKVKELDARITTQFPQMRSCVTVRCGNANEELKSLIRSFDPNKTRGLLFLDPFATEVDWETLSFIAKSKIIDVWYLFPFGALNRLLPKDHINERNANCIDRFLGDKDWRTVFYEPDPQLSLFDLLENSTDQSGEDGGVQRVNPNKVQEYVINRLKTIFPRVSENLKIFRNSKNAPLFLFCFAVSNPSVKAQNLALRIANHILSKNKFI